MEPYLQYLLDRKDSFPVWMKKVDNHINKKVGTTSDGLPDFNYLAEFEHGSSPSRVALLAIRNAKNY